MRKYKVNYKQILLICIFFLFSSLVFIIAKYSDDYGNLYNTDMQILNFIYSHTSGNAADFFFSHITVLGNSGMFWIALGAIFAIIPKTRKIGFTVLLAIAIGFLFGNLLVKNYVGRLRPYQMNEAINLIIKAPSDTSFPSGHTLCSFSSAIAIFLNRKKLGVCMIVLASAIALSRMYLFVHFPTDIIGAVLLGILVANLSVFIVDRIYARSKAPDLQNAETAEST